MKTYLDRCETQMKYARAGLVDALRKLQTAATGVHQMTGALEEKYLGDVSMSVGDLQGAIAAYRRARTRLKRASEKAKAL